MRAVCKRLRSAFRTPNETVSLLKRIWPFMKPYKRALTLMGILLLIGIPIDSLPPLVVKYALDTVVQSKSIRLLIIVGSGLIGLTLMGLLLEYLEAMLARRFRLLVVYRMRRRLFAHLLDLPLSFFINRDTGYIMSRSQDDLANLNGIMADTFLSAAIEAIKSTIYIAIIFYLDPVLAIAGLIIVGVILGGNICFSRPLRRRNEVVQETTAKRSTALHEGIAGIELIKASVREEFEVTQYIRILRENLRASFRRDFLEIFSVKLIKLVGSIGTAMIVLIGAYRIMTGATTVGNFVAFYMYVTKFLGSTADLMRLNPQLQRAMNSLRRIYDLFDVPAEPPGTGRSIVTTMKCEIIFDNVGFIYDTGTRVLRKISAEIPSGAQVALVGPSGAGKTTITHLLLRFYDPTEGRILLNGKSINEFPLQDFRKLIGVVSQDVFLFDRTVAENIAYGNKGADFESIKQAARAANAHEFIVKLPAGYDTRIGERGIRLSVGQKQRLAIAREILRNPPILILDEATSSLDSDSETKIQDALQGFKRNRTSIVIAHRLATVIAADWILVLKDGEIVEQGKHEQLISQAGFYAFLFEAQFKATYRWSAYPESQADSGFQLNA